MSDIRGKLRAAATLEGTVQVGCSFPVYEGSYEIEPSTEAQVLATRNRVMKEDLTVKEIAYQEVTNVSGGKTITIGGN